MSIAILLPFKENYSSNLAGAVSLFINDINNKSRFKSKTTIYGSTNEIINETANYNPSTPYSISHAAIDMNLLAYNKNYNFPGIIARFANFYGPYQQLYRIICF